MFNRLSTFDPQTDDFINACTDSLSKNENKWFDPVIPSNIITYSDMCSGLKQLYLQLNNKGKNSQTDLGVYGYVLVYQMYLNA